jgi:hypothetical protein
VNPYTKVPLSQASFPIYVDVVNIASYGWDIPIRVDIADPSGDTVYSQLAQLGFLGQGQDTILQLPNWDASGEAGITGAFTVIASMADPYYDDYYEGPTYTKFYANIESGPDAIQEFALDDAGMNPAPGVGNDIPSITGVPGSGMGFSNGEGSIGMKFELAHRDSVTGVRIYFGSKNPSPDPIQIDVLASDENSNVPLVFGQEQVEGTMKVQRDVRHLDQFQAYYFPKPITLPGGTHWISISQLAVNSMELGGTAFRGGGQILSTWGPAIAPIYGAGIFSAPWYGTQWGSDPSDNNGDISTAIAVDSPVGYGWWEPYMSNYGRWASLSSLDGLEPNTSSFLDTTSWTGVGTYIPLIRPIIGSAPSSSVEASVTPAFGLESIYPDPLDPTAASTTITFNLPEQSPVSLTICNILGDVVKTLVNGSMPSGTHWISWNGKDEDGTIVPAGLYLVSLKSDESRATTKLIVAR